MKRRRPVATHPFHPGEVADWRGEPRCAVCGLPKVNARHEVAEQPAEASELDRRRLGERDNTRESE